MERRQETSQCAQEGRLAGAVAPYETCQGAGAQSGVKMACHSMVAIAYSEVRDCQCIHRDVCRMDGGS